MIKPVAHMSQYAVCKGAMVAPTKKSTVVCHERPSILRVAITGVSGSMLVLWSNCNSWCLDADTIISMRTVRTDSFIHHLRVYYMIA